MITHRRINGKRYGSAQTPTVALPFRRCFYGRAEAKPGPVIANRVAPSASGAATRISVGVGAPRRRR